MKLEQKNILETPKGGTVEEIKKTFSHTRKRLKENKS